MDYDFDWYVYGFEYGQNPEKGLEPNANDSLYLEYCDLLMRAKEAGLGYRVESESVLYLVPTPVVRLNRLGQYHSGRQPAIRWKGGQELFFLNGVAFPKALWERVVSGRMPFAEIMAIEDVDQRVQAMKYGDFHDFARLQGAEMLDSRQKLDMNGESVPYELWKFPKGDVFSRDAWFMWYVCPSTRQEYASGVWEAGTVAEAMARKQGIRPDEWMLQVPLVHES